MDAFLKFRIIFAVIIAGAIVFLLLGLSSQENDTPPQIANESCIEIQKYKNNVSDRMKLFQYQYRRYPSLDYDSARIALAKVSDCQDLKSTADYYAIFVDSDLARARAAENASSPECLNQIWEMFARYEPTSQGVRLFSRRLYDFSIPLYVDESVVNYHVIINGNPSTPILCEKNNFSLQVHHFLEQKCVSFVEIKNVSLKTSDNCTIDVQRS